MTTQMADIYGVAVTGGSSIHVAAQVAQLPARRGMLASCAFEAIAGGRDRRYAAGSVQYGFHHQAPLREPTQVERIRRVTGEMTHE